MILCIVMPLCRYRSYRGGRCENTEYMEGEEEQMEEAVGGEEHGALWGRPERNAASIGVLL